MTAPSAKCFLVQLSRFSARNIDVGAYPPPYFLCGNFCCSTFRSGACLEESSLSWSLCHSFEYDESVDKQALQMVLECYSGDWDRIIGRCFVQLQELMAAVSGDSMVTLCLCDGPHVRGQVSFYVELEKLLSLTLHAVHVALVPHPPAEDSLYVELSCSGVDGLMRVRSEKALQGSNEWATLPLLQYRSTLASLVRDGVAGALFNATGKQYAYFHILVADASVAPLKAGATSCHFSFSSSVESAAMGPSQRCVGDLTVSTEFPVRSKPISVATLGNDTNKNSGVEKMHDGGVWSAGDGVVPPKDLQVMEEVLREQYDTLVRTRDQLARVRKQKDDVRWQLEVLCRRGKRDIWRDPTMTIRRSIEEELKACMKQRRGLEDELDSLQQRRANAARERAAREGEWIQQQQSLVTEHSEVSCLLECVSGLQVEMKEHKLSEERRQKERLRVAVDYQQNSCRDAEMLNGMEQRLRLQ